jgi:hypothetical protein
MVVDLGGNTALIIVKVDAAAAAFTISERPSARTG